MRYWKVWRQNHCMWGLLTRTCYVELEWSEKKFQTLWLKFKSVCNTSSCKWRECASKLMPSLNYIRLEANAWQTFWKLWLTTRWFLRKLVKELWEEWFYRNDGKMNIKSKVMQYCNNPAWLLKMQAVPVQWRKRKDSSRNFPRRESDIYHFVASQCPFHIFQVYTILPILYSWCENSQCLFG